MKLLLLSTSPVFGKQLFEHCHETLMSLLNELPEGEVLFVPYALHETQWDKYATETRPFFDSIGQPFKSIHACDNPAAYIAQTKIKAIFTGGGNSFLLLKTLQDKNLIEPIKQAIRGGVGYVGESAGTNIACPTIQTTNDMPIVQLQNLNALHLVNFQINPHFVPGALLEGHMGETREERIAQYHEINSTPVVGLPEQSWIAVDRDSVTLGGADAVIFEQGKTPQPWMQGPMRQD